MEIESASNALSALGHPKRLGIFRLLVQAGKDGLSAGSIAEQLGMPSATLSFHLAHLSRVGLITGRQASRFIYYSVDYEVMNRLLAYLTDNCCNGAHCLPAIQGN